MVKVGMDTDSPGNVRVRLVEVEGDVSPILQHAGYDGNATYNATGFSQLHESGTGGVRACPMCGWKRRTLTLYAVRPAIELQVVADSALSGWISELQCQSGHAEGEEESIRTVRYGPQLEVR